MSVINLIASIGALTYIFTNEKISTALCSLIVGMFFAVVIISIKGIWKG